MALRGTLAVLLVSMLLVAGVAIFIVVLPQDIGLESFGTRAAFQSYLRDLQAASGYGLGPRSDFSDVTAAGEEFSGTNVQVAGVDEADFVKTDGLFIYLIAGQDVVILRAHPPSEMGLVARISGADLLGDRNASHNIVGLFLYQEILAVITSVYSHDVWVEDATLVARSWTGGTTLLSLFSVLDPEDPKRLHEFELTGEYRASRLKDATVYLVLHQYLWAGQENASYPAICVDGACEDYDATRIFYDPEVPEGGSLTNVVALDLATGEVGSISVLTGYASTVYMSHASLFVTFGKWSRAVTFLPGDWNTATTSIYRISIDGTQLQPVAGGEVKGWLLNQFSLDEHGSHLRVATTTWDAQPQNQVYVLDEALEIVGALEGLAPGESIYSARFVGDLGYLVTFEKVDPFFVLDLADPRRPEVLGYLKIPGFSEYLHPMDETHILGVGKDTTEDPSGEFSWFQGLKLSLFDVSDVRQPTEVAKLLLGNRGSSSPVLYDHKAFLYIREARLVVLPASLVTYTEPSDGSDVPPWTYGTETWQGALVISVNPEGGFEVLSQITHVPVEEEACLGYGYGPNAVFRSFYIGAYLYTISPTTMKAHNLADFTEAGSLVYDDPPEYWGCEGSLL
jgi:uncharacterized secreted protein with C-terminal beta-propeller domain